MKIALLISGYLRGFETNIEYIKQHVIQGYQCDIYIHITDDDNNDKYLNKPISLDVIKNELKPKVVIFSNNIKTGLSVKVFQVENYICWGTPDDYETYLYWQIFFDKCEWHEYTIDKDITTHL